MSSIPQPTLLYPQQASSLARTPQSNGSYGPVFAVLAVIAILAVTACLIGRLCARRIRQKHKQTENNEFCKGDIESMFASSSVPVGKVAKGHFEPAWNGMKRGEIAAKHIELKGAKLDAYTGGNVGAKARV